MKSLTLLARGADQEVRVRHSSGVELSGDRFLVDLVDRAKSVTYLLRQTASGTHQLGAAAVADHQIERQRPSSPCRFLHRRDRGTGRRRQSGQVTMDPNLHALPAQLVPLPHEIAVQEPHQRGHLPRRTIPVLQRESIERERLDPNLHGALDHLAHGAHPGRMAAVTEIPRPRSGRFVHDDGDV